jgi:histidine ammonia-lyase
MDLAQFLGVVQGDHDVELAAGAVGQLAARFDDFADAFKGGATAYGLTTGFGPMVGVAVDAAAHRQLQENLVRSHAVGLGEPLPALAVRAVLVARLQSLLQGHSAIRPQIAQRMARFLSLDILPVIPAHGGVGASGDLVQLAHLAAPLMGEGDVWYRGQRQPAATVLAEARLAPLVLEGREGLALVNGTSCMTGLGLLQVQSAERLLRLALRISALATEILQGNPQAFSAELQGSKRHPGQAAVAASLRRLMAASPRLSDPQSLLLQPHYSIRCTPQVLGPILESIQWTRTTCLRELNSCSDNPVWDPLAREFLHGGNFHGDYVATAMDVLKAAIVRLQMLLERQLDYLLDDRKNKVLPAALNYGVPGLELGLQGWQFTATSTTAESQSLAFPHRLHSISCNQGNQDIVSMGTNCALQCGQVVRNGFEVAAILCVAVARVVAHIGPERFSAAGQEFFRWIDGRVDGNRGGATPGSTAVQGLVDELAGHAAGLIDAPMDEFDALDRS